jgi:cell division protease FtsH
MGHALTALSLTGSDPVHKVSIIPRGIGALGYTIQRPTEDRYLMTRTELENKIAVLLGGRAAEQLVFNEVSTGAADDLAKVTDIARDMVTRYGMDAHLGPVVYEAAAPNFLDMQAPFGHPARSFSEQTAQAIDQAVRERVEALFKRTVNMLNDNRDVLDRCAQELLRHETLDETALSALTQGLKHLPATQPLAQHLSALTSA